jgi:predicted N-acetyltransferase YhbS
LVENAAEEFGGNREMLVIRDETPRDVGHVRMINIAAFDQPDEADLVDALRAGCREC